MGALPFNIMVVMGALPFNIMVVMGALPFNIMVVMGALPFNIINKTRFVGIQQKIGMRQQYLPATLQREICRDIQPCTTDRGTIHFHVT